jgi:very-short-patch-repair endonuclease
VWQNLNFRSESEVQIARALDREHVWFIPNCKARLGHGNRQNREADFLICHEGKWGILEVDGEPFHPPSRTVDDHERDRLFRTHGIRVVEHFDASECYQRPEQVVRAFLEILRKS